MKVSTIDPISLNRVACPDLSLFVIKGEGEGATRIFFESAANLDLYLAIPLHGVERTLRTGLHGPDQQRPIPVGGQS